MGGTPNTSVKSRLIAGQAVPPESVKLDWESAYRVVWCMRSPGLDYQDQDKSTNFSKMTVTKPNQPKPQSNNNNRNKQKLKLASPVSVILLMTLFRDK